MSLSNTTVGATYACNGVTTTFAIPFAWQATSQIKVYQILISTGVSTLLVLTTDYTYTPNPTTPTSIVMNVAPSALYQLRVERTTPVNQLIDFVNNSAFLAEDLEEGLDKIMQVVQELDLARDNSLQFSQIDYGADPVIPLLVADALLSVNPTGDGFVMGPTLTAFNSDVAATAAAAAAAAASQSAAAASAAASLISQNAAAASAAAALVTAAALAPAITGSRAVPEDIVAGVGIAFVGTSWFNTWYVRGSGGAVTVTANPQIAAGTAIGQRLRLIGRSPSNPLTFSDGTGLDLNGAAIIDNNSVLDLEWDGTNWVETSRR